MTAKTPTSPGVDAAETAAAAGPPSSGRLRRGLLVGAVVVALLVIAVSMAAILFFDRLVTDAGRPDLVQPVSDFVVWVPAVLSAATVGAVLALRRPRHPVGWLFLTLSAVIVLPTGNYASYGALARPGSLPLADMVGVVGDSGFLLWFALLALIMHLTPDGRPLSRLWAVLMWVTVAGAALGMLVAVFSDAPLSPPLQELRNPLGVSSAALDLIRQVVGVTTGLGVLVGALSLLARFRRASGLQRKQLLWLAPAAVLIPIFVAASFAASYANNYAVLSVVSGLFVVLLPVATGLAITRYHLSRALTYLLVSAVLAVTYVVVLTVGAVFGGSQLSAVVATLAAVSVAGPAYRWLQNFVDRRFNRRRFDAVQVVRGYVRDPAPEVTPEDVLRQAVADPTLRVSYWVDGRGEWVTGDGRPANPGPAEVELRRHDRPIARVGFDGDDTSRELVEAAVVEARPELDNAGLRAAVALQLVEVRDSRARIVSAADASRRQIERDLHDGAQQHLVALAVKLGLARKLAAGDPSGVDSLLEQLRDEVQETLTQVRELAHGIYPPLLREHGLGEALRNAAGRAALPTSVEVGTTLRFRPEMEAAIYFCCLEAMQNAAKHAGEGARVDIRVDVDDDALTFEVRDDGVGFDSPAAGEGHGFVNMRDRIGAYGGPLSVTSAPGRGTVVRGSLPLPVAEAR
ncbi:MAG: sensor histidine kinase [Jiangellaceae bacterium]